MFVRQTQNLKQDLIIIKVHKVSIEKNAKYHSSVLMNIMVNTVITGLMIGNSHWLNNVKRTRGWKRRKHFGNTGLNVLHLWNICIEASFLIFLVFGIHFFNHFIFLPFFLSPFNFFCLYQVAKFWIHFCDSYFFHFIS